MNEQVAELIELFKAGDKVATMVVLSSINAVLDLGYVRSGDLGDSDLDYYEVRQELDEDIDMLSKILNEHFNITGSLQDHVEGHCECQLSEQTFESECACGGNCGCEGGGGGGTINIIPFPKKEE